MFTLLRFLSWTNLAIFRIMASVLRFIGLHQYQRYPGLYLVLTAMAEMLEAHTSLYAALSAAGNLRKAADKFAPTPKQGEYFYQSSMHVGGFINQHGGPYRYQERTTSQERRENAREAERILKGLPAKRRVASFNSDGRVDLEDTRELMAELEHELESLFGLRIKPSSMASMSEGDDDMPPTKIETPSGDRQPYSGDTPTPEEWREGNDSASEAPDDNQGDNSRANIDHAPWVEPDPAETLGFWPDDDEPPAPSTVPA